MIVMIGLLLGLACAAQAHSGAGQVFTNPLLPSGADPWVVRYADHYYYTDTQGERVTVWKTREMTRLAQAPAATVWRAPRSGPGSASIWAPELHRIGGRWYLYYAASEADHDDDAHRHVFVLENASPDPTVGRWLSTGMLDTRYTGIDPTVFKWRGTLYLVYSAYVGDHSDLIIARMTNPWTISKQQVDIARPSFSWEMQGGRKILEAPQFLAGPGDKLFITYSASACWSDDYAVGMLTANKDADLTNPRSWRKSRSPVFAKSAVNGVYAPGGLGFFKSPDGKQNWIVYHANSAPELGCGSRRSPRVQQFRWRKDGTPDYGIPVRIGVPLVVPSR